MSPCPHLPGCEVQGFPRHGLLIGRVVRPRPSRERERERERERIVTGVDVSAGGA